MARVIATAVPLSVWTKCVPFLSGSLQRIPRRRAWKSVQFEAEVISPHSPASPRPGRSSLTTRPV